MKAILGLMTLFILLSTFIVAAGDVLKLDFSNQNQQLIGLKEGDRAEFYLSGERNVIILDKIKQDSADITVFVALNTNNYPQYITLSRDRSLRLDIERDDIDDLFVSWYKSDENYAYFLLKKPEVTEITGNTIKNTDILREDRQYDKYVIIGFIIFVTILIFIIIFKHKKGKISK